MCSAAILDTPISAACHVMLSGSTKAADGELMERLLQGAELKEGNIRQNWSHKNTFVGFYYYFSLFRCQRRVVVVISTSVLQGWMEPLRTARNPHFLLIVSWGCGLAGAGGGLWRRRQIQEVPLLPLFIPSLFFSLCFLYSSFFLCSFCLSIPLSFCPLFIPSPFFLSFILSR